MNIIKVPILILLPILLFPLLLTAQASIHYCNRTCGSKTLQYPFGFSPGCDISLNCTNSAIYISEFPVQAIDSDNILITIAAQCNRSIQTLRQLYSPNYAPTFRNAILLQKCSAPISPCVIPATLVQTHFESPSCDADTNNNRSINNSISSSNYNISCYTESQQQRGFIDFENVTKRNCSNFVSSIFLESLNNSTSSVSLEVQVVQLGWWLKGNCQCSEYANCTSSVQLPETGRNGSRCKCKDGFEGDGYLAGSGCRKVSSVCNPEKYMSGKCGGTTRVAVLIGGLAAGASLMITLGLICCFVRRRSKSKARHSAKRRLSEATGSCSIPIYDYKEIQKATNSFSEKQRLGTGAYGTVYAGKLHSDEWVAIKRIRHKDADSIEQVMNEIKLLSSVSHPNLVRLLGCSIEYGEQILVYEFMPNGTLCQHLQRERGDGLSWQVRLTIATETAQAIAHLHSAIKPPIYHRDIKSSNILLDKNFQSKVADFGLSRLGMTETSHISTAPQGTPGYLDPQYHQCFHLSDKSDVYSFGVVLVEIISALKVVDFTRPQDEVNLAALAIDRIGKGHLDEIIDPFLEPHRDAWTLSSVHKVAELAFRCLAFHRDMRPSMMEVAAELERITLSRWESSEEKYSTASSSEVSSCSSSSNISEKPLSVMIKKAGLESGELFVLQTEVGSINSMERVRDNSPISVQDPWLSEQSSPSSSSLLNNVIQ